MRGKYLIGSHELIVESNIYADRSSLVLDWILRVGINKKEFSIREVARERKLSVALVQKVFSILVLKGYLKTKGVRTAKKYSLKKPDLLLNSWLEHYSIVKKCKIRTYQTGYRADQVIKALKQSKLKNDVALSLHSAAEVYGVKNTNLKTLELYLLKHEILEQIKEELQLEPREKGYEVLLIVPYYKSLLDLYIQSNTDQSGDIPLSPILLTFLDLYHFPLRGREQAEFMAERMKVLKRIKGSK